MKRSSNRIEQRADRVDAEERQENRLLTWDVAHAHCRVVCETVTVERDFVDSLPESSPPQNKNAKTVTLTHPSLPLRPLPPTTSAPCPSAHLPGRPSWGGGYGTTVECCYFSFPPLLSVFQKYIEMYRCPHFGH